jgi:hypothetical protein
MCVRYRTVAKIRVACCLSEVKSPFKKIKITLNVHYDAYLLGMNGTSSTGEILGGDRNCVHQPRFDIAFGNTNCEGLFFCVDSFDSIDFDSFTRKGNCTGYHHSRLQIFKQNKASQFNYYYFYYN